MRKIALGCFLAFLLSGNTFGISDSEIHSKFNEMLPDLQIYEIYQTKKTQDEDHFIVYFAYHPKNESAWPYGTGIMVLNSRNNALIWYYLCNGDFPIHEPDWIDFNQDGEKICSFLLVSRMSFRPTFLFPTLTATPIHRTISFHFTKTKTIIRLWSNLDADGIPEILDSGYREQDHYGKNPCHFSEPAYAPDFRQSLKDEFTKICLKSKVGFFQYGSEDLYSDLFIFDPIIIYRFTKNRLTDVTGKYAKHLKWRIKILRKYYKNTDQNCKEMITNLIRYFKHRVKTGNQ